MTAGLKTTPIHSRHIALGANMADFAGFEMPLWYDSGIRREHLNVLSSAGLFDTAHMSELLVAGPAALPLLEHCFTRPLERLQTMRCAYGGFLDESGCCLDDAVVYPFSPGLWMICVNAGMGDPIARHLKSVQEKLKLNNGLFIQDVTAEISKIDIQGPASAKILAELLGAPDKIFHHFPYFSFQGKLSGIACRSFTRFPELQKSENEIQNTENHPVNMKRDSEEIPVLLSRSGYTGEFGFEIFVNVQHMATLWDDILNAGSSFGILPCGLGARDSLRTSALLPLSHQDIGPFPFIRHPWEFALPFNTDRSGFTKSFLGDQALLAAAKNAEYTLPFAGFSPRKTGNGPDSVVCSENGQQIGHVLSCTTDMSISRLNDEIVGTRTRKLPENFKIRGLSCGFVKVNQSLQPGSRIFLAEKKRSIEVEIRTEIRPDLSARKSIQTFL